MTIAGEWEGAGRAGHPMKTDPVTVTAGKSHHLRINHRYWLGARCLSLPKPHDAAWNLLAFGRTFWTPRASPAIAADELPGPIPPARPGHRRRRRRPGVPRRR